ncbi:MAG: DsrE family protein [Rhodospirillales bacterium]|jgi:tRNA 2-thiouridine synthesizing protein C|nr:DsrE family protein [Rhodospirillales bacterium]
MAEFEFETEGVKKTFTFMNRKAPYGTIYALEVLETVLISAAFEQHANIIFVDDGVYQIKAGQDTTAINMKNFSPTYGIIEMEKEDADEDDDIDMVWRIIVEKESLDARGLTEDDFKVSVEVLSAAEIADIVDASDCVISG